MAAEASLLLALDLTGTFAFALNGALTAVRMARLDIVGVVTLGMITALGGGIIRDILLGSLPPATFSDWRYLAVAAGGGLVAFFLSRRLDRLAMPITVLDAAGLSFFAVTGASKALDFGLGAGQAVILGAITGVGGGTIRDTLLRQIPSVLRADLYAIPALVGAAITVATIQGGVYGVPAALGAAIACFAIRMLGVRFDLNAPFPPGGSHRPPPGSGDGGRTDSSSS
ncbi:trimeric intracellular cation channel family protein [Actinomadura viridis]|uniref:trimeric intracellular cation channel family protein n=1 Tax=Actinomadura viridis TaxID=58110 RepID=UPI00368218A1